MASVDFHLFYMCAFDFPTVSMNHFYNFLKYIEIYRNSISFSVFQLLLIFITSP